MIIDVGSSMYLRKYWSQRAPTAPSTVLWSALKVTFMKFASLNLQERRLVWISFSHLFSLFYAHPFSALSSTTSRFSVPPTARMHDCGGLMIAQNCVTLNMPKFEMVKVPPWNSCGWSLPSRAFAASDLTSCEIDSTPLRSALNTIGVMRPLSVDTATDTSTASNLKSQFVSVN